ncbi:uncharacterized protein GGS25DRAFT_489923 [Hypoxylon fragiforme]|uniref:uncharacterized protein n=1 Tax=Hypoxylon fragiforme TaxID=63214 RepID=UPI0020C6E5B2|nr:uncharacterized protein GGS25DRAFT_489923 [Hypoxylon fragiforme]KAI2608364.1 hypothetical protein GGS25DRAFT_489923 [Hypoxylon fragiforme]
MATPRTLPRTARRLFLSSPKPCPRRSFISLPSSEPQLLSAARRLPYNHERLYELIADIDSYSSFLPYCQVSRVTQWSDSLSPPTNTPTPTTANAPRRWPTLADLTAGWGGFEETYTSRVTCRPDLGIVEAVSGTGVSEISSSPHNSSPNNGVFQSLITRWTVTPTPPQKQKEWSDVRLTIKYSFANPLYAAVSAAVADKVASVMVEAFVAQARRKLGTGPEEAQALP